MPLFIRVQIVVILLIFSHIHSVMMCVKYYMIIDRYMTCAHASICVIAKITRVEDVLQKFLKQIL